MYYKIIIDINRKHPATCLKSGEMYITHITTLFVCEFRYLQSGNIQGLTATTLTFLNVIDG